MKSKYFQLGQYAFILGVIIFPAFHAQAQSVVAKHGRLQVVGNRVVDHKGQPLSLAGNSFYMTNTGWSGEKYYNADVVRWLKRDWGSTVVRATMGVEETNGYLTDPASNQAHVETLVSAAIANGVYVIIDFHSFEAHKYQSQAIHFFQEMATKYAKVDNVIYEIYNEPKKVSWHDTVKPYAEAVIAAIRAIDPDHLIVVGSPSWDQDVDVASADPLTGINLAYSLHFYAGEHKQKQRDKAAKAMANGIALFITEWGSVNSDGNGPVDIAESNAWMAFARANGLSHCVFSIGDKAESTSVLRPGASAHGGWSAADLTASGAYARSIIKGWPKP